MATRSTSTAPGRHVDRLPRSSPTLPPGRSPSGRAGTVTYSAAFSGLQAPQNVNQASARWSTSSPRAGGPTSTTPTRASRRRCVLHASATSTAAAACTATNAPIWGSYGSPNSTDWYEVNLGSTRIVDEARIHFHNDRAGNRYRPPSAYNVQYYDGSAWVNAPSQVKTPGTPQANYNRVSFGAVSTARLRVQFTHASGSAKTGLTELKLYRRGSTDPGPQPGQNLAPSATPSASYTSAWESVAALNDGVTRLGPTTRRTRVGTWPKQASSGRSAWHRRRPW